MFSEEITDGKTTMNNKNKYIKGLRDGVPIGLGYLSVSFSFGMLAVNMGLPIWSVVLISMTNLTSAGQFAGIGIIAAGSPMLEMIFAQFIINLRYSLMSVTLSQKTDETMTLPHRLLSSFFITDEIFAVASGQPEDVGCKYMYGLGTAPFLGWSLGTLLGAVAGNIMPDSLCSALGIALYAMFVAIVLPPARRSRPLIIVVAVSIALSCLLRYLPLPFKLSGGTVIIICAVAASALGAAVFPVKEDDGV